ncbi:MAG: hypothetical protein K9K37_04705 [Desulfocapsa sp.]|nr:hypothetical protein [Desulfocapsa sp.]
MWYKKTVITFCSVVALFTTGTLAFPKDAAVVVSVPASPGPTTTQGKAVEQRLRSELPVTTFPLITLESLASAKTQALKEQESLPMQIGLSRNVGMLFTAENTAQQLNWHNLPDSGNSAGIQIHSSQALALRVGMTVDSLPENAELRFYSTDEGVAVNIQLVSARQILATLLKNREANPDDPDGKIFWSPTMNGDTLGVEIYLPEDCDPSSVQIAFPLISHISILPFGSVNGKNSVQSSGDSDPCQNDATCTTNWLDLGKSVAVMKFTTVDGTYVCTGSLLNDSDPETWEPYFLTANHCISTQAVASSLETYWFWQSSSCNSGALSASYEHHTGGATLLQTQGMDAGAPTSSSMDTTLLHLNTAPPVGAVFAGWTTAVPPGFGTARAGIHHPKADWKKISFGVSTGDTACGWADASDFFCVYGAGNFYGVDWTNGGTEGGSSGSALYFNNEQVIGTLTGSDGSCAGSSSFYSSFRAAYAAGNYEQWLAPPPPEPEPPVVAPINFLLLR